MLHFLSTLSQIVTDEAAWQEVRTAAVIFGLKKINSNQLWEFALGVKDTTFSKKMGIVIQLEEWKEDDIVSNWLSLLIISVSTTVSTTAAPSDVVHRILSHHLQLHALFPFSKKKKNMPYSKTTQFYTVIFNPYYITTLRTQEKF